MTKEELKQAKRKWFDQRQSARNRGIKFDFSFEDWLQFWLDSGHWSERGVKTADQYVMSRIGDTGPYKRDNVVIKTNKENVLEGNVGRLKPQWKVTCLHCKYEYGISTFNQHLDSERCRQKKAPRRVLGY
jgi:hypothetical protein